jgi:DNA-binding transcriptional LysR family regulator
MVRIDSLLGMVAAVRDGMGVAPLLCILADLETNLLPLAEPIDELDTKLWILTHPAHKHVARVKALSDFLYAKLRADDKLLDVGPH